MYFTERRIRDRRYLVAAQAVWDAKIGRSYARQVILGSAEPPPKVELSEMRTVGRLTRNSSSRIVANCRRRPIAFATIRDGS